ncbi:MAG: hypothetical protein ACE5K4_05540 [Candidatus Hydrothermarchaeota archaeon]
MVLKDIEVYVRKKISELEQKEKNYLLILCFFGYRGGSAGEIKLLKDKFNAERTEKLEELIEDFEYKSGEMKTTYVRIRPEFYRGVKSVLLEGEDPPVL